MKFQLSKLKTNLSRGKIFLIIFVILLIIGCFWLNNQLSPVGHSTENVVVNIPSNSTTSDIAEILSENELIRNEKIFTLYTKVFGYDTDLKAGEYLLNQSLSSKEILGKLTAGEVNYHTFTIPEGYTVEQIASTLDEKRLVSKEDFLFQVEKGEFDFPYLEALPEGENRLEGFLFPDTYNISRNDDEKQVIQLMLNRFLAVFDKNIEEKGKELGMDPLEIVTLASIIEREAALHEEMEIISAVFHNRLDKGMLLQSCATVQYAIGETKEVLLYEDMRTPSPYNTYLPENPGLPPGPIANPGINAIEAAVNPADVDYLYFVSKGDGSHHFSSTLAEHNAAKEKYLD